MEKKKVAIIEDSLSAELLKDKLGDNVIVVGSDIVDLNKPAALIAEPTMYIKPYVMDPADWYDDSWNIVPKSDRRGTVADVRNSKVDPKIQRNDPCSCGSGKKYKKCCGR